MILYTKKIPVSRPRINRLSVRILLTCFLFCVHCDQRRVPIQNLPDDRIDVAEFLKNSTNIDLSGGGMVVEGTLEGEGGVISYSSISKDEFYRRLEQYQKEVRFFSPEDRINEAKSIHVKRVDSLLSIATNDDSLFFRDNRPERLKFFYGGQVGDYHLVKKIHFEDSETLLYDRNTGRERLSLYGIGVSACLEDGTLLYTNAMYPQIMDEIRFMLMSINGCEIDTLVNADVDWYPGVAFFGDCKTVFYMHNEDDSLGVSKSSYAKMEILLK